ncbi:MAG: hypothetical protein JSW20_01630 [Nitrospiraceae bacterium]|nr:MAG: hypothetical protein JSW20_01630 [Nitrospiraceae bacterium]
MNTYGIRTKPSNIMVWQKTLILMTGMIWMVVFCPVVTYSGDVFRADLPKEARISEQIFG